MIESLRLRWTIIIVVLVGACLWVLPNFVSFDKDHPLYRNKIVYGLDIQGGLHIVLGVDVKGVIQEKIKRMARSLDGEFKDKKIAVLSVEVNPKDKRQIIVSALSAAELDQAKSHLSEFYDGTIQIVGEASAEGQSTMTLQYYDLVIQQYKSQTVDQAQEVIRGRIDAFGVAEPVIAAQGDNRILVQLPGIENTEDAKTLINKAAVLYFRGLSEELEADKLNDLIKQAEGEGGFELGKDGLTYDNYVKKLNETLDGKLPKDTQVVFEKLDEALNIEAGRRAILVKTTSDLSGDYLENAAVGQDEFGKPEVNFDFNVEGRRRFAALTKEQVGSSIVIVLDNQVKSIATVKEEINSSKARITLGSGRDYEATKKEASLIATSLRAGALPAALEQLEERTVGPTLGADSIAKGKNAGIVALILVLGFMLLYYRGLGFVANIALTFNILLIFAVLTSLGATLTLPGVAGIILTVGMAVDANVIIFERIKEELRKGTGLKSAIADGFSNAFSSIFDSNITTALTCVILIYYGTGPVRGFGVSLLIGIITSMFTSIFVARAVIDSLIVKFKVQNLVKV